MLEFFATNAPDPPYCTQTHVLGRFGPFRYSPNFGAKRAEPLRLIQKFVQRSRVGIFRKDRTRSTQFEPKLMSWGILDCFVTAKTSVQNELNWSDQCIRLCNEVTSEFFAPNAPNPPHWTPNSCFVAFQTVSLLQEIWCKMCRTGQLMHKFVQRSRVGILRNERT
jgi:hypothetical protein